MANALIDAQSPHESMRPQTRAARQAYLYGTGDGVRMTNPVKLAKQFGMSEYTVRKWMPTWEREFEATLQQTTEHGLSLSLSSETLLRHRQNTETLAQWVAEARQEVESIPKLTKLLENLLEEFANSGDPKDYKQALGLYDAFMQSFASRRAGKAHFIAVQKAWKENSGIDSLQTVAETREKTLAAGRAKLKLRDEAGDQDGPNKLPPAHAGQRPGAFLPVEEVESFDPMDGL